MAIVKIDSSINVNLNMPRILNKVENEQFGLFLIKEWKKLIDPFTPHLNGIMQTNVILNPFLVTYNEPYSRYMYGGIVYVDPKFNAGGFTNDGGETWLSRWDIKKVPSGRRFNYSKYPNMQATDHWDKAAEQAGQKEKLIRAANNYLRRIN